MIGFCQFGAGREYPTPAIWFIPEMIAGIPATGPCCPTADRIAASA